MQFVTIGFAESQILKATKGSNFLGKIAGQASLTIFWKAK
jgi:hypothetical protein